MCSIVKSERRWIISPTGLWSSSSSLQELSGKKFPTQNWGLERSRQKPALMSYLYFVKLWSQLLVILYGVRYCAEDSKTIQAEQQ